MLKINKKLEYALIALRYMSTKTDEKLTSAKEICDIYGIPFDPTSRVLQIMAQHDILHAEQGPKGGYRIAMDLHEISMLKLSNMIIGPIEIANCFHGDYSNCEINHSCHIIAPMLNINERIQKMFAGMNIADLLCTKHAGEKSIREKQTAEEAER